MAKNLYNFPLNMETSPITRITFTKPTTTRELLGASSPDPNLDLTNAPLHIGRIDSSDQTSRYLAIFDHPLLGSSFNRLLTLTAPYPVFRGDYEGIIDDWRLYDDPKQIERQERHDALKEHIEAFKQYRTRLMNNLLSQGPRNARRTSQPLERATLIGHNLRALGDEVRINLGLAGETYPPNFTHMFAQHLRGERYNGRKYDIPGANDHFVVAIFGMRGGTGDLIKNLDVWGEFLDTLTPTQKEEVALDVERFEFLGHMHDAKTRKYVGLGTVEPTVAWESTPDIAGTKIKRDLNCFPLNSETSTQLDTYLKNRGSNLTGFFHYNTMVGPLVIKYLLPEIGRQWKERLPLPKSKEHGANFMAEQAVLVLASMMRGSILASSFFQKAEEYFNSNKNPAPKEAGL